MSAFSYWESNKPQTEKYNPFTGTSDASPGVDCANTDGVPFKSEVISFYSYFLFIYLYRFIYIYIVLFIFKCDPYEVVRYFSAFKE